MLRIAHPFVRYDGASRVNFGQEVSRLKVLRHTGLRKQLHPHNTHAYTYLDQLHLSTHSVTAPVLVPSHIGSLSFVIPKCLCSNQEHTTY